jgi:hypothetical protein
MSKSVTEETAREITDWLTVRQACKLLPSPRTGRELNWRTMLRWILEGRLRGWRNGRWWYVRKCDVLALPQQVSPTTLQPAVKRPAKPDGKPKTSAWAMKVLKEAGYVR